MTKAGRRRIEARHRRPSVQELLSRDQKAQEKQKVQKKKLESEKENTNGFRLTEKDKQEGDNVSQSEARFLAAMRGRKLLPQQFDAQSMVSRSSIQMLNY